MKNLQEIKSPVTLVSSKPYNCSWDVFLCSPGVVDKSKFSSDWPLQLAVFICVSASRKKRVLPHVACLSRTACPCFVHFTPVTPLKPPRMSCMMHWIKLAIAQDLVHQLYWPHSFRSQCFQTGKASPFVWNSDLIKTNHEAYLCWAYLNKGHEVVTIARSSWEALAMRGSAAVEPGFGKRLP